MTNLPEQAMPLPHLMLLRLTGEDAESFLQNYLTADVKALGVDRIQTTSCCNRQGQVVADIDLISAGDHYLLILHRAAISPLKEHLGRFLPFSKSSLNPDPALQGFFLPVDQAPLTLAPGHCHRNQGNIWLRYQHLPEMMVCWSEESPDQNLEAATISDPNQNFQAMEIIRKRARVVHSISGKFLPQALEYEALGAIDYDKGCYLGQEIIARTHYLGKLKSQLLTMTCSRSEVVAGSPIFNQANKPVGTVINSVQLAATSLLLGVIKQTEDQGPIGYLENGTSLSGYP